MDINDEVLRPGLVRGSGKTGCNVSDRNTIKRMVEDGYSTDDIAQAIGVRISVVEGFVAFYTKAETKAEKPAKRAKAKKVKKEKVSDDQD